MHALLVLLCIMMCSIIITLVVVVLAIRTVVLIIVRFGDQRWQSRIIHVLPAHAFREEG